MLFEFVRYATHFQQSITNKPCRRTLVHAFNSRPSQNPNENGPISDDKLGANKSSVSNHTSSGTDCNSCKEVGDEVDFKFLRDYIGNDQGIECFSSRPSQNPNENGHISDNKLGANKSRVSNLTSSGRDCDSCKEVSDEVDFKFSRDYIRNGQGVECFRRVENDGDEIRHPLVKEVCRLIDQRCSWTPNFEEELRHLIRSLKPQQVCAVLRHQEDARIALQLFYWADRQWRYRHDPIVYEAMLDILGKTSLYQGAKRVIRLMARRRIRLQPQVFGYLMMSYSRAGDWRNALQVFSMMEKAKIEPSSRPSQNPKRYAEVYSSGAVAVD